MASSGSVGTLSWSAKLDSNEFKKGVKNVQKQMKQMKKNINQAFKDVSKSMSLATGAIGGATLALGAMTKASADLVNSQKILADSIGSTQSEIAGLELASSSLGVSYDQMIDKMREIGGVDAFKRLADKIASASTEAEQMRLAQEALGNEGLKLLPVLQQGADGLADFEHQARQLGLALPDDKVNDLTSAWESLEDVQHRIQGGMRQLSAELAPTFDNALSAMTDVLDENSAEIKVMFETMAEQFDLALDGIVFAMESAGIIDEASNWTDAFMNTAWALENAFKLALKGISWMLEKALSGYSYPFRVLFDQITGNFLKLFKVGQTVLRKLGQEVKEFDQIIEGIELFKDGFDAGNVTGAFDGLLGSTAFDSELEESWKRIEERVKAVREEQEKLEKTTADIGGDLMGDYLELLGETNDYNATKAVSTGDKDKQDPVKVEVESIGDNTLATAGSIEEFNLMSAQRKEELAESKKQTKLLAKIAKTQPKEAGLV